MYVYTLWRAMSRAEYEQLEREGFESTFKRRWKFFTVNPEYIGIILDEIDYGLWKPKYEVVVRFYMVFRRPLEELTKMGIARAYRERGYTTVALTRGALAYLEKVEWERVNPQEIPRPRPLLEWVSKTGRVCRVYRRDKALRILREIKDKTKIRYIAPELQGIVSAPA